MEIDRLEMGFTIGDRIKDRIGDRSIGDEIGDGYFDIRLKEPTLSNATVPSCNYRYNLQYTTRMAHESPKGWDMRTCLIHIQ